METPTPAEIMYSCLQRGLITASEYFEWLKTGQTEQTMMELLSNYLTLQQRAWARFWCALEFNKKVQLCLPPHKTNQ